MSCNYHLGKTIWQALPAFTCSWVLTVIHDSKCFIQTGCKFWDKQDAFLVIFILIPNEEFIVFTNYNKLEGNFPLNKSRKLKNGSLGAVFYILFLEDVLLLFLMCVLSDICIGKTIFFLFFKVEGGLWRMFNVQCNLILGGVWSLQWELTFENLN